MDIETLRGYCLAKKEVAEEFPFGNETLVFKVKGKIFLLASLDRHPLQFNVKCDPEKALAWREQFDAVQPGYHMNKKHWNTVIPAAGLPLKVIKEMIDDSYALVVRSLSRKDQAGLL